jgi:hypothetical protein
VNQLAIDDTVALMNFDGFKELFATGKGVLVVILMIAASVLFAIGTMTMDQWKTTITWLFGFYAAASAVRAGMTAIGNRTTRVIHTTEPIPSIAIPPKG